MNKQLTDAQRASLKSMIDLAILGGDTVLGAALTLGDDVTPKNWLNTLTNQDVWKDSVSEDEIRSALVYTELDNLPQAKQWQFDQLMKAPTKDATKPAFRQAIADIFTHPPGSTGTDNLVRLTRAALIDACKRKATRAEDFLAGTAVAGAKPLVVSGLLTNEEMPKILRP